jgi:hypothetical protein
MRSRQITPNLEDGEAAKDLLRLLKANFFDGLLPCGHQLMPIPDRYYASRVGPALVVDTLALLVSHMIHPSAYGIAPHPFLHDDSDGRPLLGSSGPN